MPDHDDRTDTEFDETWENERAARRALINQVKLLANLPHPPRASRRRQLAQLVLTVNPRPEIGRAAGGAADQGGRAAAVTG
jgi:hypothetical protein